MSETAKTERLLVASCRHRGPDGNHEGGQVYEISAILTGNTFNDATVRHVIRLAVADHRRKFPDCPGPQVYEQVQPRSEP